jgi:chemotaxis protein methyltransferase CheR
MSSPTIFNSAPATFIDAPRADGPAGIGLALAHAIIDTVRDPLLVLDEKQRITAASRSFYKVFQPADDDVRGRPLFEIEGGQWNIPELRTVLEKIAKDFATFEDCELSVEFPRIGRRRTLSLNARKVFYEEGVHSNILLAFEDITDRHSMEQQVLDLLREKDMLLEEMQHRVSNSLQIIASILLLKARTVQSEETRLQLVDAHQRVLSIAAVQKHLQVSGTGAPIAIASYLKRLCETLAKSMIGDSRPISLNVIVEAGTLVSQQAVSVGLIVTELVMNALKHAFPEVKDGAAIIVSYKVAGTDWKLSVSDNGIGAAGSNEGQTKGGLGTSLVKSLAKQLAANIETEISATGRTISLTHATFKPNPSE